MERPSMKGTTMKVLLEIIPEKVWHQKEDYEAFTLRSLTEAADIFEAEFRKLNRPEDVERLVAFLNGSEVWDILGAAFDRDCSFTILDRYVLCGNHGFTYRLSPYVGGRHS